MTHYIGLDVSQRPLRIAGPLQDVQALVSAPRHGDARARGIVMRQSGTVREGFCLGLV
jgi:hypothetical protein